MAIERLSVLELDEHGVALRRVQKAEGQLRGRVGLAMRNLESGVNERREEYHFKICLNLHTPGGDGI